MANLPLVESAILRIHQQIRIGSLDAAEAACRELLQAAPNEGQAWFQLNEIMQRRGRLDEAIAALRQAIALDGTQVVYWNNISFLLRQCGKLQEAEAAARRATEVDKANPVAWILLGNAFATQQQWAESLGPYREALSHDAGNATAWGNLGTAEQQLGRFAAAKEAFERSLSIAPGDVRVMQLYAFSLTQSGHPEEALTLLRSHLACDANLPWAWEALGYALLSLGHVDLAESAFRRSSELEPRNVATRCRLASLLAARYGLSEAESICRQIIAENPSYFDAWTILAGVLESQAKAVEARTALERSLAIKPDSANHSKLLLNLQYTDDAAPDRLLEAHREWDAKYARQLRQSSTGTPQRETGVLRIGFLSGNFARHPIGFLALSALEHLDRSRCSVVCYSDRSFEDETTLRFRRAAESWRPIFGMSDEGVAELIHKEEIDILFDLDGHSGKRLPVFARKAAPIQVTWLGYPGTTGVSAIDFVLADRFHIPEGDEPFHTENALRMPNGYACYGAPNYAPEVISLPAQFVGYVTFGSFNNPVKYAPRILDLWAEILQRVPTSQILLKYGGLDSHEVQEHVRGLFMQRGVDGNRIIIEGWSEHRELLAAYNRVDLALDTQPYSGGVTTCEALWMGVPVVTYAGKTFAGRHATSHLHNADLAQFVAYDGESYVDLAVQWANRLDELADIRSRMREVVRRSPLCDASQFATDFLSALTSASHSFAISASRPT